MDEQRRNAYLDLINALLTCPDGQEAEILKVNQNLIDTGLLERMEQVAAMLAGQGNQNAANWLRNMAAQLAKAIGNSSAEVTSEAYQSFLVQVLQASGESEGNPRVVFPILQANLDKLDDNFAQLLRIRAKNNLPQMPLGEAKSAGVSIVNFSSLIQQFPQGNRATNIETAIIGYEAALIVFTRAAFPKEWATIQNNLGVAYADRIRGDRAENLEQAIYCCQAAMQVHTRETFPRNWAETKTNLGNAYLDRIRGDRAENLEQAIHCYTAAVQVHTRDTSPQQWATSQTSLGNAYKTRIRGDRSDNLERAIKFYQAALQVFTREAFPERWATTQNGLGLAYNARIQGEIAENLELAIRCYQVALQVRTREAFPQKWATLQTNLGSAYCNRIRGERAENLEQAIQCYQAALQVYTPPAFPQDWAATQTNLGNAYKDRLRGERAQNLELAIAALQAALQVRTREAFPQDWAMTQNNLGNVYLDRIRGERAENLEQAIQCCQAALSIYTPQAFPQQWAMVKSNLGIAYSDRIRGERAENLEQAIQCCQAALQVYTLQAFPQDWATSQTNLGNAYCKRIRGDRAKNLELAIQCYQAALQVRTREAFPQNWADVQNNLGLAYSDQIRGDRAKNLELAIQCYQAALQVRTREAFSEQWATLQTNLGSAYSNRIHGDRAKNLELAIQCYQAALQIRTREAFPQNWADTQNNLGIAYRDRIRGERAQNLELAIAALQAALQVRTREALPQDWAMTQNNLGIAYFDRIQGDRSQNLEDAIVAFQTALQVRTREAFPQDWAATQDNLGNAYLKRIDGDRTKNLEQALQCYQAALQVRTREAFPQDWATTQNNLGFAYRDLGQPDKAIACFRSALEIYTPTAFPVECFKTGNNLGNIAFAASQWAEAIKGYGFAIEAVETSRSWISSDARRQEIQQQAIVINVNLVQACINNGQLDKAIEYVERSRSKRLVDLMASNDLDRDGEIRPEVQEYLQQYENLQQRIDQERFGNSSGSDREVMGIAAQTSISEVSPKKNRAALAAYNETIKSLEAEKQQVWEQLRNLDPVLAGQIQVNAPNLADIQRLIDHQTTAILSFYTTRNDTHVFVLRQNQISYHKCLGQGWKTLHDSWILDNWLRPYVTKKDEWHQQISSFLAELSNRLQLDDLIAQHLSGIEELILVPHLYLHQIPFAALPLGNGQYLGDKFLIRYIPSCQVLEFCQKRSSVSSHLSYGTVEDATEDLPCANFEGEQIAQMHNIPEYRRLKGRTQATVSNYRQLAKQVQVLHSSHHAQSRLDNPLESKLELGDGAITLGQLMTPGWQLPHLSDVFLSCCETGLGVTQITDDILTLSSGFLCAGARNVVSTLWSVEDLATALFSIFYHRHRQQGSCRPAALQQAQEELRSLSGQTLATVYQPQLTLLLDQKFQQAEKARKEAKANRDKEAKGTQTYLKWDEQYKQHYKAAERIRKTKNRLNALCQESFPFSHPFYWAAFTCSGLR